MGATVHNEEEECKPQPMDVSEIQEISYEDKLKLVNAIAQPMAPKKLTKKIYKCIKKGDYHFSYYLF